MFLAPALNQWWWGGGMIYDLILTNEIAVRHTEVLPNFFVMLKNLVIFSTCLPIIDILYLYLFNSERSPKGRRPFAKPRNPSIARVCI